MDNQPSFDRGLLVPVFLGVFSVFGICLVLVLGRLGASRAGVTVEETATPFHYIFLGTEPAVVSETPEEESSGEATNTPRVTPTEFDPFDSTTPIPTQTESSLVVLSTLTPSPVSSSTAPLNPGTYDDTDSHLRYDGDWIVQRGVSGAFQSTLHVSSTLGNSVSFRFIGQQIRLFYQPGSGLGTIRIDLDGVQFELDQSDDQTVISEWSSPLLINGTHTLEITHLSGGAINLDQLIVPDVLLTPTVTSSP
jgi:hypothetical protein